MKRTLNNPDNQSETDNKPEKNIRFDDQVDEIKYSPEDSSTKFLGDRERKDMKTTDGGKPVGLFNPPTIESRMSQIFRNSGFPSKEGNTEQTEISKTSQEDLIKADDVKADDPIEKKGFFKKLLNLLLEDKDEAAKAELARIRKNIIDSDSTSNIAQNAQKNFISKFFGQYEERLKGTDFYKYVEKKVNKFGDVFDNFLQKHIPESREDSIRRSNLEREKSKERIDLDPNKNIISQLNANGIDLKKFQFGLMNARGRDPFSDEPDIRKVKIMGDDGKEKIINVDFKKFAIDAVKANLNPDNPNKIILGEAGELYGKMKLAQQSQHSLSPQDQKKIDEYQKNANRIDNQKEIKMRKFAKEIGLELLKENGKHKLAKPQGVMERLAPKDRGRG
jgi:hypothetical protein